jgi:hypothetical protein
MMEDKGKMECRQGKLKQNDQAEMAETIPEERCPVGSQRKRYGQDLKYRTVYPKYKYVMHPSRVD